MTSPPTLKNSFLYRHGYFPAQRAGSFTPNNLLGKPWPQVPFRLLPTQHVLTFFFIARRVQHSHCSSISITVQQKQIRYCCQVVRHNLDSGSPPEESHRALRFRRDAGGWKLGQRFIRPPIPKHSIAPMGYRHIRGVASPKPR